MNEGQIGPNVRSHLRADATGRTDPHAVPIDPEEQQFRERLRAELARQRTLAAAQLATPIGVHRRITALLKSAATATAKVRRPIPLAVNFILLAAIGVATFHLWPSNSYGITIKKINAFYYTTDHSNLKLLVQAMSPANSSSNNKKSVFLSNLLQDSSELQYFIERGTKLPETTSEMRIAKAKAFIIRARLENALGGKVEVDKALNDVEEAVKIYKKLPANSDRTVFLAEAFLIRSIVIGKQDKVEVAFPWIEQAIADVNGLDKSRYNQPDTQFLLSRLLANRGIFKAVRALNLAVSLQLRVGEKSADETTRIQNEIATLQKEATADTEAAILIVETLSGKNTDDEAFEEWAARFKINYGRILLASSDRVQAESYFTQAVELAQRLLNKYPDSVSAKDALALANLNLGDDLFALNQLDQSLIVYEKAKQQYDELFNEYNDIKEFSWARPYIRKLIIDVLATQIEQLTKNGNIAEARAKKLEAMSLIRETETMYSDLLVVYNNDPQIINDRSVFLEIRTKIEAQ